MKRVFLCLLTVLLLISCSKQNTKNTNGANRSLQEAQVGEYMYCAFVKNEKAVMKKSPDSSSETICVLNYGTLFGIEGTWLKRESIDGKEGFWCLGWHTENSVEYWGWVFSKDLNIPDEIQSSEFIAETNTKVDEQGNCTAEIRIKRYGPDFKDDVIKINAAINSDNKIYFYPSSYYMFDGPRAKETFFDPVGIYSWNSHDNELIPVTWQTQRDTETNTLFLTSDNKYLMLDSGTSPGLRGLTIINLQTDDVIFKGHYYRNLIDMNDDDVTVAIPIDEFNGIEGFTKSQLEDELKNFKTENKEVNSNFPSEITALFKYNFRTNVYTFIRCNRMLTQ